MNSKRGLAGVFILFFLATLAACGGGGGGGGGAAATPPTFTIGGTVSSLAGSGLVLRNNGGDSLPVVGNGAFTFSASMANGAGYNVTVQTQPANPGQTCSVTNGTGTVSGANVTGVVVNCVTHTYTVGGAISGLGAGKSVVLQNNGTNNLTPAANGSFTFTTPVADGAAYAVTVLTQPVGQTCAVTSGNGTLSGANVTDIAVACSPWTRQFGTTSNDYAQAVATDAAGNIFVAGYTDSGDMDGVGPDTLAGATDLYLAKYSANGSRAWIRQLGTSGHDFAYGVATDSGGNTYVVGTTNSDLDGAGSQVFGGGADAFIVKYDAAGTLVWIRQLGNVDYEEARGVAVDGSDNVYITGSTSGDIDNVGPQAPPAVANVFLAKYDASGTLQWVRQFGSATEEKAYGVAVSGANVYLTGYTYGDLDGAGPGGSAYIDIFLASYDTSGNQQWISQVGSNAADVGFRLAVDGGGNIYVTGYTYGDLDGAGAGTNAGGTDMVVARFNASGTLTQVTQIGTATNDFGSGIAVDAAGNVYLAGYTWANPPADYGDLQTTRINADGTIAWTRYLATPYTDGAFGLDIALRGNDIYVAGTTAGNLDGNTNAGTVGNNDAFIVKYDTSGNKQ